VTRQWSALALAWALAVLLGAGCGKVPVLDRPPDAYEHPPLQEVSTAYLMPGRHGDTLTRGLRQQGWFCADARRNSSASQIWCRLRTPSPQGDEIITLQLILDTAGQLRYAEIQFESNPAEGQTVEGHFQQVLTPSLLTQWPDDTEAITQALEDERARVEEMGDQGRSRVEERADQAGHYGSPAQGWQTSHAVYAMPNLYRLTVTPLHGAQAAWPFGADHYATTLTAALPDLRAGGYQCHYAPQTDCTRPNNGSNQTVRMSVHGDQIVTASMLVGSHVRHGRLRSPHTDEGFPSGLPFLTDRVEAAVRAQLERCRRSGTGYAGVVAGTVLIVDAADPEPPRDTSNFGQSFTVTVGVPLMSDGLK
jgi:hypothetical protein